MDCRMVLIELKVSPIQKKEQSISGVKNHMEIVPWNEPVKQTEIVVISWWESVDESNDYKDLVCGLRIYLTYPCKVIGHFVLVARLHKNSFGRERITDE